MNDSSDRQVRVERRLPLEPDPPRENPHWTTRERLRVRLRELYRRLACQVFRRHTWLIRIVAWDYSPIDSLDSFRRHRASTVECQYCAVVYHVVDLHFDHYRQVCYRWETSWIYTYLPES